MSTLPLRVERMSESCRESLVRRLQAENEALRRRIRSLELACQVAGEEIRAERARQRQAAFLEELERQPLEA